MALSRKADTAFHAELRYCAPDAVIFTETVHTRIRPEEVLHATTI